VNIPIEEAIKHLGCCEECWDRLEAALGSGSVTYTVTVGDSDDTELGPTPLT